MASSVHDAGRLDTPDRAAARARSGVWLTDLLLFFMALIWGVNFSVVKYATGSFAPLAFNALRMSLAAAALLAVASLGRAAWPSRRDTLTLMGLGVLGNGVYQIFFAEGIARTRAGDAALVIAASPALIAIVGRFFGVERVTRRGMIGIGLSIAGIAFVVLGGAKGGGVSQTHSALVGDLLVLCGSVCWAFFTIWLKPFTHRVDGVQLAGLTMLGGTVPVVAVSTPLLARTEWAAVGTGAWLAVLFSGLLSLCVAYLFWYRGVRVLGPTRTAMYSNLQPVIALLVAWPTLGETPTVAPTSCTTAITSGILLTRR
jgi:drug/metabolite transporter (DMT)-like permease